MTILGWCILGYVVLLVAMVAGALWWFGDGGANDSADDTHPETLEADLTAIDKAAQKA